MWVVLASYVVVVSVAVVDETSNCQRSYQLVAMEGQVRQEQNNALPLDDDRMMIAPLNNAPYVASKVVCTAAIAV